MSTTRLFVLGDSISIGYGPYLSHHLDGFTYARKNPDADPADTSITGQNGGDSGHVVAYLRHLLSTGDSSLRGAWLLLNCGLHDIKRKADGLQVDINDYVANLEEAFAIGRKLGATRIVWCRTTPVDDAIHASRCDLGVTRLASDVEAYNHAADGACQKNSVDVIDLHAFTLALGTDAFSDHVHYTPEACDQQAKFVAAALIKTSVGNPRHTYCTYAPLLSLSALHTHPIRDRSPKVTQSREAPSVQQLAAPARLRRHRRQPRAPSHKALLHILRRRLARRQEWQAGRTDVCGDEILYRL